MAARGVRRNRHAIHKTGPVLGPKQGRASKENEDCEGKKFTKEGYIPNKTTLEGRPKAKPTSTHAQTSTETDTYSKPDTDTDTHTSLSQKNPWSRGLATPRQRGGTDVGGLETMRGEWAQT